MLDYLPNVERRLHAADLADGRHRLAALKQICGEWSIFARYSPLSSTMKQASRFLDDVKELKEWLKP